MRCRSLLRLATLLLLAPIVSGCGAFMGKGSLDVDLEALKECRRLTPNMKVSEISETTDYRTLSAESGGTINKGNKAIQRRNKCDDKVIEKYATAKGE